MLTISVFKLNSNRTDQLDFLQRSWIDSSLLFTWRVSFKIQKCLFLFPLESWYCEIGKNSIYFLSLSKLNFWYSNSLVLIFPINASVCRFPFEQNHASRKSFRVFLMSEPGFSEIAQEADITDISRFSLPYFLFPLHFYLLYSFLQRSQSSKFLLLMIFFTKSSSTIPLHPFFGKNGKAENANGNYKSQFSNS